MSQPLIPITSKQAIVFACFLVLYEFLTYIANDMIMPGMVYVVKSFNAPESNIATSLTYYMLGGASLQLILGPVSDAYGRRPVMLLGAILFVLFTLLIACSNSMDQFLIARFLQGMGLCFITVVGYATIQEIFAEMDAIRLIAIMSNAAVLAPLLGPVLGAIIIFYASWRLIFVIIALFAFIALWGLWRYMPEPMGQIKTDGQIISKVPLSPKVVFNNYKRLLTHIPFCLSAISFGLSGIPCIAWIALAPVIMVVEAKLTVIQYGLWQLPVFTATILGNWALHRLTYRYELKTIIGIGALVMGISMIIMTLLPLIFGNYFLYLMPGVILYFFSLSIVTGPMNRFCLYLTSVSKGTVSALVSLSFMSIGAIGIEIASYFYKQHINLYFALYCSSVVLLFFFLIWLVFTKLLTPQVVISSKVMDL